MKNSNTTITPVSNNKVLLLLEKPSQYELLLERDAFIEYLKNKSGYDVYYTIMISAFNFEYPKEIKYKNYPKTNDLKFRLRDVVIDTSSLQNNTRTKTKFNFFSQFEELILCPDPDHTGVYSAILTLEKVLGDNWQQYFKKITYMKFISYDRDIINKQIDTLLFDKIKGNKLNDKNKSFYEEWYKQGKIKRYFEYNYNINSNIFFKEILKTLNIQYEFTLSKYMIMAFNFFYHEIDEKGIRAADFFKKLQDYKGSGKYKKSEDIHSWGIGGPASRCTIVERLIELELIEKRDTIKYNVKRKSYNPITEENTTKIVPELRIEKYFKSELGEKFFNLLSKKTYDKDLVFRLTNVWMLKSFEEAKNDIDTYMIEMFKTQKRKNKYLK
jgi:hypothetical protein